MSHLVGHWRLCITAACAIAFTTNTSVADAQAATSLSQPGLFQSSASSSKKSARISIDAKEIRITDALNQVAAQSGYTLVWNMSRVPLEKRIAVSIQDKTVEEAVAVILKGADARASVNVERHIISVLKVTASDSRKDKDNGAIVGTVIDSETKQAISGVIVSTSGSNISVKTDSRGLFSLKDLAPGEYSLMFRILGYSTVRKAVVVRDGKPVVLNIALSATASTLNEVITTATGPQRRVDISNDVVKIDAEKLMEAAPVRSVTDLLQAAQVNGVTITPSSGEPGAPKRIRIGGVGSISQNNDPVVIVDGVWVKSSFSTPDVARQLGRQDGPGGYLSSRLDALDPNTIETIEVVRGPAAATLYGPDAANGVILITTKRGSAGPARWNFNYSHDRKNPTGNFPSEYDGVGQTPFSTEPMRCTAADVYNRRCVQDSLLSWSNGDPLLKNEVASTTDQLNATVSGGSSQIRYSLSAGFSDQIGTRSLNGISYARMRQMSLPVENRYRKPSVLRDRRLSTRLDITATQGLEFSLSLDGSQQNSREDRLTIGHTNSIGMYDSLVFATGTGTVAYENKSSKVTRGMVSLMTRWNPSSWALFTTTLGADKELQREYRVEDISNCIMGNCNPRSNEEQTAGRDGSVYTIRAHSSFTPSLGRASRFLAIQPGITFDLRRQINFQHLASTYRQADSLANSGSLTNGPTSALGGISLNANIRLFNRISFDPAIRHDFSGAKELKNNSKSYPRFGTSWLVSDEPFFRETFWLSTLRLRGAFGYASVQPDLSQLYGKYVGDMVNFTGTYQPGISLSGVGNPNLQPERSSEIEVGFDADMFSERVMLTLTYANKQNSNTLINRPLAPSTGVIGGKRQENIAKVVNQATMIQTIIRPIDRNNIRVRLTSNLNFSFNEIKSLGSGVSPYGTFDQRYVEGYPVGGLWARPLIGMLDVNGDGFIKGPEIVFADSLAYMGFNMPRYTMGHNIEIGFLGNFTFNAFVDYKGPFTQNRRVDWTKLRGYWDVNIPLADQVLPSTVSSSSDMQTVKEIRLQSASIAMNVPTHIVQRLGAQSVHVSLQGSNLGLWSQYRGRDPGINSSPIGERLTDAGNAIGLPRSYSVQFRVRY